MAQQSLKSHARWLPPFHFFVLPVFLLNVGFSIYWSYKAGFKIPSLVGLLVAIALFVGAVLSRVMAMKVQDRVIRLEERRRMERLLPPDLQPRIDEFSVEQCVALRFASDAELPELARRVLNERLNDRKAIKQLIKTWRPDLARA